MSKSRALNIPAISTRHQNLPVYSLNHSLQLLNKSSNNYSRKRHYNGDSSDSSDTARFCCGVNVAYQRFGKQNTFPLLYVNHLRGSIDVLNPLLFNIISKNRGVSLYDSFGIGHSEGAVPDSTTAMASIAAKLLAAIGVSKVDVIGFSMGGGVAQILAWDYPQLVHKLVLAGTQSAIGDGVVLPPRDVLEGAAGSNDVPPTEQEMHGLFFYPSETSLAAGKDWWKRIHERQVDGEERKEFIVGQGAGAQLTPF